MCRHIGLIMIKRYLLSSFFAFVALMGAGILIIDSNVKYAHKLMANIWNPPNIVSESLNALIRDPYIITSTDVDTNIQPIKWFKMVNLWLSLDDTTEYYASFETGNYINISRFDLYFDKSIYQADIECVGFKGSLGGYDGYYMAYGDNGAGVWFFPAKSPIYTISIPKSLKVNLGKLTPQNNCNK